MRLVADDDHRLRLGFDFGELPLDVLGANRQFVGEAVVADEVMVAVQFRFRAAFDEDTAAGQGGEAGDNRDGRGDDERTGTSDDEQDEGAVSSDHPGAAGQQRRDEPNR